MIEGNTCTMVRWIYVKNRRKINGLAILIVLKIFEYFIKKFSISDLKSISIII